MLKRRNQNETQEESQRDFIDDPSDDNSRFEK